MTIKHFERGGDYQVHEELLRLLRKEFIEKAIATKTSWGKNEIERAFDRAVADVTAKLLDRSGTGRK